MPVIKLPQKDKQWTPNYYSEFAGDFVQSFNIDLRNRRSYVCPKLPFLKHTTEVDDAGLTVPASQFIYAQLGAQPVTGQAFWIALADKVYRSHYIRSYKFVADTLTNSPTGLNDSDGLVFYKNSNDFDSVVVSLDDDLARFDSVVSDTAWNPTWWTGAGTLNQPALISGVPHPLAVFGNLLIIGDDYKLHSVLREAGGTFTVTNTRVLFPTKYTINWIKATKDKIYIGLEDDELQGEPASLFVEYDPVSEGVRQFVIEEGRTVGWQFSNSIGIVDARGNINQWNGTYFDNLASFPQSYKEDFSRIQIHRNGAVFSDTRLTFLIRGFPKLWTGGVWSYDLQTKILSQESTFKTSTDLSYGTGDFIPGALYSVSIHAAEGLGASRYYLAGLMIQIGVYSGSSGIWSSFQLEDNWLKGTGGFLEHGYLISPKLKSDVIENIWRNILITYDWSFPAGMGTGLVDFHSRDHIGYILVKYRTKELDTLSTHPFGGTWVNIFKFTMFSSYPANLIEVGDEVEVISGTGDGFLAHISKITTVGLTSTIELDDDVSLTSPVGQVFNFVVDKWRRIKDINNVTNINANEGQAGWRLLDIPSEASPSDWIQFKIELRGGAMIDELQVGYQQSLIVEK